MLLPDHFTTGFTGFSANGIKHVIAVSIRKSFVYWIFEFPF